jgi:hypothetical protein
LKAKDDEKEDERMLAREVSDGLGHGQRAGNARRFSGVREGHSSGSYTMNSYFEHVKTDYISGDASVLMFGATASRQVRTVLTAHHITSHRSIG